MIVLRSPVLSTRYASDTLAIRDGVRVIPHWTVEMGAKDRFDWEGYIAIEEWLRGNITGYEVHRWGAGASSIEAVTFRNQTDALLFYMRFV